MLEKVNRYALYYDFYGQLLTIRQQEYFELYYHQDWSLGEIAGYYEISRSAVHDLLKRTVKQLDNYENKLRLVAKFIQIDRKLDDLLKLVERFAHAFTPAELLQMRREIKSIVDLTRD